MPRRPVIIALVVALPVLYLLARPGTSETKPSREPRLDMHDQSAADRERATVAWLREEIAVQARSRAKLDARLVELEGRLSELQRAELPATTEPEAEKAARDDVSEATVATWMDGELHGRADQAATAEASGQIHESLENVGLLNLRVENVACGAHYCRASFFQDSGDRPAVRDLFGAPPFTSEGFTIEEPDGRTAIYFARNGAKVSDFRGAAFAAAAP